MTAPRALATLLAGALISTACAGLPTRHLPILTASELADTAMAADIAADALFRARELALASRGEAIRVEYHDEPVLAQGGFAGPPTGESVPYVTFARRIQVVCEARGAGGVLRQDVLDFDLPEQVSLPGLPRDLRLDPDGSLHTPLGGIRRVRFFDGRGVLRRELEFPTGDSGTLDVYPEIEGVLEPPSSAPIRGGRVYSGR